MYASKSELDSQLTYSQVKTLIQELGRDKFEELSQHGLNIGMLKAACELEISPRYIEASYEGYFRCDEDFVQDRVTEQHDQLMSTKPSYIRIDWEATTRDYMQNYGSHNGHIFFAT